MTWKEDWKLLRDLNRGAQRDKALRRRKWWNRFREKIANFILPSHLTTVQVLSDPDFTLDTPSPAEVRRIQRTAKDFLDKHLVGEVREYEARSTPVRAPNLVGEAPQALKDFGLGAAWAAEHTSGLGGLGGCRGNVYTKGFSNDHLYVFGSSEAADEFIRRMGCQHTHYPVCHQWSPGPPLKWKTQWGGNTSNA